MQFTFLRVLTILLFLILGGSGHAQFTQNNGGSFEESYNTLLEVNKIANRLDISSYDKVRKDYSDIKNEPYWYKQQMRVSLVQNDNLVVTNVPLRLDRFTNELVATDRNGQTLLLIPEVYQSIQIIRGTKTDLFRKVHPTDKNRFCQVIIETENGILFKDIEVKLNISESNYVGMNDKIREFRRRTKYYLRQDGNLTELYFKKKKFFKTFLSDERSKLETISKSNNLKLKHDADYIFLLTKYLQ